MTAAFEPDDWFHDAACRGTDPGIFYPADGRRVDARNPEAIAICSSCTVRTECLTWALDHSEEHGIWGGLNPTQRRNLKRRSHA